MTDSSPDMFYCPLILHNQRFGKEYYLRKLCLYTTQLVLFMEFIL